MMEYELIRSRRRSLALQLKQDGTVLVRAPLRVPKWQIEAFLRQPSDEICDMQATLQRMKDIVAGAAFPISRSC